MISKPKYPTKGNRQPKRYMRFELIGTELRACWVEPHWGSNDGKIYEINENRVDCLNLGQMRDVELAQAMCKVLNEHEGEHFKDLEKAFHKWTDSDYQCNCKP